jgi:hypothetical protein
MVSHQLSPYSSGAEPLPAVSAKRILEEILVASGATANSLTLHEEDFTPLDFHLGELLSPAQTEDISRTPDDFFLIAQGRVRLVSQHPTSGQPVPLRVLEVGSWFGGDQLLYPPGSYPYQALGAGQGRVYRVSHATLAAWIAAVPGLGNYLAEATAGYQRVAFFRTASMLQHLSGPQVRTIVEQSQDVLIPVGTQIADFCREREGLFWLRSGTILAQQNKAPVLGEVWVGVKGCPPTGERNRN